MNYFEGVFWVAAKVQRAMWRWVSGMARPGLLFVFLLLLAVRAMAGTVTLAWDPVTSSSLAGYMVYYGPAAGNYTTSVDVGNTTSYAVTGLVEGTTYHFAATAYDATHTQSGYSNDVSATIPYGVPVAQFSASTTSGTAPLALNFLNTSTGTITTYAWTFGDGGTSSVQSPAHVYSLAGVYTVSLTATGPGGSNTKTNSNYITVTAGGGSDVVWFDDVVPAGATQTGTAEGWTWVSSNPAPFSGALAHQSALLSGVHQHYFYDATTTLSVSTGDTLYTYVYLDPVNPPSEVMLQWNDGTWAHRAYWGANLIAWGDDATNSRRYMGALPATGQWVRLAVPAALIGLEGSTLNGTGLHPLRWPCHLRSRRQEYRHVIADDDDAGQFAQPRQRWSQRHLHCNRQRRGADRHGQLHCRWQPVVQQRRLQRRLGQHQDRGVQQQHTRRRQPQHRRHLLRRRRQPGFVQHPCTIARSQCQHRRHLVRRRRPRRSDANRHR